ncbi:hypothetical protein SUGI_0326110 [Cryptomeria japonica]|uniref:uncharacterized protein LOC131073678 n=1 Tax=Cryptomeria japonica TaxID=3369 RepID=UPI0024089301|nr:uncharacterized protein LOC131073678 [Cryptomeria japonica]GLJ18408.1 hypothetical protein SUGI_0326110 [Cryptomeria japonica]
MQKTLAAQYTPRISPNHLHAPINVVKVSPLQRPSCALGLKYSKWGLEAQWRRQLVSISFNRKREIVCLFDGIGKVFGEDAKDAARKAFEKAREGKDKAFRMWKEVSEKTAQDMARDDEDDGDDDGFGGGRYGGGGGSGDPEDEDDWKETFIASMTLLVLYMKMRGTRWTRDYVPYTDFDALKLWAKHFLRWVFNSEFLLFIEINYLWAKCYLHRLRNRSRTVASSTSTN